MYGIAVALRVADTLSEVVPIVGCPVDKLDENEVLGIGHVEGVDWPELFEVVSAVLPADPFREEFPLLLVAKFSEVPELEFLPEFVPVDRDFFVGGSPWAVVNEFRLPWDGLLLFSDLDRLFVVEGGEIPPLFAGTLRRKPIITEAMASQCPDVV